MAQNIENDNPRIIDIYQEDLSRCLSINESQEFWLFVILNGGKIAKKIFKKKSKDQIEYQFIKLFNRISRLVKFLDQYIYRVEGENLSNIDIVKLIIDESILAKKDIIIRRKSTLIDLMENLPSSAQENIIELAKIFALLPRNLIRTYQDSIQNEECLPKISHLLFTYNSLKNKNIKKIIKREASLAREILIISYLPYVKWYSYQYRNLGLDYPDIIQEGNLGLIRAIDKYELKHNARLKTYAVWWIKQKITRAIADHSRTIRIPVHKNDKIIKVRKEYLDFIKKFESEPDSKYLAKQSLLEKSEIMEILRLMRAMLPLDEIRLCEENICEHLTSKHKFYITRKCSNCIIKNGTGGEDDPFSLPMEQKKQICSLVDSGYHSEYEKFCKALDRLSCQIIEDTFNNVYRDQIFNKLHEILPYRDFLIMVMRFGFDDESPSSLQEIGDRLGVTRERIRQIETRILQQIKYLFEK